MRSNGGKKSPDGSFLVPEKWSPVYLSYNNALKALAHVDNAKVSQLAATVLWKNIEIKLLDVQKGNYEPMLNLLKRAVDEFF